ncbi:MAG TPA: alpha-ketoglutarate-dependent dioxygenase AlkB [Vicinamibacteria bacterium]|nr:alpha-ketoglutarate-dependent dioxygenase AlkB [Vicinamibacteria bacterium]
MPQLSLFEPCETVLVNDARGRIVYTPGFVSEYEADHWFRELRRLVEWKAERRVMYDRELDVPRLTARYRLDSPDESLPPCLRAAAERVFLALRVPFTSVGLNLYRSGKDSVAPHNDHLHELERGQPIALLSLGATRRMTIRAKQPPRRAFHTDLERGSLFVMSYDTQVHYDHGIPKTEAPVGERISLAFRVRPSAPGASVRY